MNTTLRHSEEVSSHQNLEHPQWPYECRQASGQFADGYTVQHSEEQNSLFHPAHSVYSTKT